MPAFLTRATHDTPTIRRSRASGGCRMRRTRWFFVLEAVAVVQEKRTTTTWLDADAERQFNAEDNDVPF